MSHLGILYAKDLGVKIGFPTLQPHYFPILQDKYVTFHNSDKCPSKSYSYWEDVIKILKHEFDGQGIKIFQVGTKDDKKIDGVDEFFNETSFKQSSFLIENSMGHFGIDSAPVHIASALDVPTVSIYSHTYAATCSPLWSKKGNATVIESHRNGNKPSFSNHEDPKTIDLIKPEEIANAVFKMVGLKNAKSQKTLFFGTKYKHKTVDIIPSEIPNDFLAEDATVRVRMDVLFNEAILQSILLKSKRKIEIVTKERINTAMLDSFKDRISKVVYKNSDLDQSFLSFLSESGLDFQLLCLDEKEVSSQRLKFFDYEISLCDELKTAKKLKKKYKKESSGIQFSSGRVYLIGDKSCLTLSNGLDDVQFWVDAEYFRVYKLD